MLEKRRLDSSNKRAALTAKTMHRLATLRDSVLLFTIKFIQKFWRCQGGARKKFHFANYRRQGAMFWALPWRAGLPIRGPCALRRQVAKCCPPLRYTKTPWSWRICKHIRRDARLVFISFSLALQATAKRKRRASPTPYGLRGLTRKRCGTDRDVFLEGFHVGVCRCVYANLALLKDADFADITSKFSLLIF